MNSTAERLKDHHCNRMQDLLEEGLRAIVTARTAAEADRARRRAQERLADLVGNRRDPRIPSPAE